MRGTRQQQLNTPTPQALNLVKAAYSVREVREVLGIGHSKVYELIKAGKLKPVKLGKRTLFLADDLAAFLRSLREAA